MCRPVFSLLPVNDAFEHLTLWLKPQMPEKLLHDHEKISDAQLVAMVLLQRIYKYVYFRCWWRFLKLNHFAWFPSEIQARLRLMHLTPVIERLSVEVQKLEFMVIDSEPLPVSTFNRRSTPSVFWGDPQVRNLRTGLRIEAARVDDLKRKDRQV
jgi:hypothetical protein